MARPCEDCLTSMKFWGVSKMLYSISNGDIRTEDVEIALEIYRNDTRTETALNGTITYGGVI